MNKTKILLRLIVSPFILGLMTVSYTYQIIKRILEFIWYGGEVITFKKEDKASIEKIYKELKN